MSTKSRASRKVSKAATANVFFTELGSTVDMMRGSGPACKSWGVHCRKPKTTEVMYYDDWMSKLNTPCGACGGRRVYTECSTHRMDYKKPVLKYDMPAFYSKRKREYKKQVAAKDEELSRYYVMNFDFYNNTFRCHCDNPTVDDVIEDNKAKTKRPFPNFTLFPSDIKDHGEGCPRVQRTPIQIRKNTDWVLRKAYGFDKWQNTLRDRYEVTGVNCAVMDKATEPCGQRKCVRKPTVFRDVPMCRCRECIQGKNLTASYCQLKSYLA